MTTSTKTSYDLEENQSEIAKKLFIEILSVFINENY